jgi:dolichol kinase
MRDLWLSLLWGAVLAGGVLFCVLTSSRGLKTTYVRDLLHIGTGLWVLGLPFWERPTVPVAITATALVAVTAMPLLAGRLAAAEKFYRSVSDEEERWSGIVLFVFAYAALTALGFLFRSLLFPAACAMAALSLGDGPGGFLGSRFGRAGYRLPWGKRKTWLGSAAVALGAALAVGVVWAWFRFAAGMGTDGFQPIWLPAAAFSACLAEAASPRSSDNVLLPAAVFLALLPAAHGFAPA